MQAADYLKNLRHLPPAPRVVPELMRLLNMPDQDSSRIVKMISYDASLTANILHVSNSAFFGAASPSGDLQEAVTRLGFQQVYQLVIAATGARLLSAAQEAYGMENGDLWRHSVATAVAAQLIARSLGDNENIAFTAALLHDIGKTILSQAAAGSYTRLVKETESNGHSLMEAETKVYGINHAEMGGQLLQHWNFPPSIISAVWFHHAPRAAGGHQRLASVVYLGNMVSSFMGHGYGHAAFAMRGRADVLTSLQLTGQSIPTFMLETFQQLELIETLFAMAA